MVLAACGGGAPLVASVSGDAAAPDSRSSTGTSADAALEQASVASADPTGDASQDENNKASGVSADANAQSDGDAAFIRPICGMLTSTRAGIGCSAAAAAILSSPQVVGPDGGPLVSGQDATVSVLLSVPTEGLAYPCVGFAADSAVTFNPYVPYSIPMNPVYDGLYVLSQGQSQRLSILVQFSSSIPSGTTVHFQAWVDSLNAGCTNGASLEWDVTAP